MLEFSGQVVEFSMPVGRGTKGPLGHLWVQSWTDNAFLVIASPRKPLVGFCLKLGQNVPLKF